MKPKNLLEVFQQSVDARQENPCFRYKEKGTWRSLSWNEVYRKVNDLAGGLTHLGIKRGDRVAIFAKSSYEWTITDFAILASGAITVPIYESSIPDQAGYILKNAEVKICFVENEVQLKKVQKVISDLPQLKQLVLFAPPKTKLSDEGIYILDEILLVGSGQGDEVFQKMKEELTEDSEASFVYTSGTTGYPKGAILTHGNFLSELIGLRGKLNFTEKTESLIFLPLAHILARAVQFMQISEGFIQCYAESIDKLMDNIIEVKPHLMASVPRIFEKVHTRVMQGVESGSAVKKKIFNWALAVGMDRFECQLRGKTIPLFLALQWSVAYRLAFSKLHEKLGGRIQYFISGGAPLSKEIGNFFSAAGFIILEGYGLTETSAAITCNTETEMKIGTVGKPLPGVEIKIARDGEILVKGGVVFKGYYQRPEDTAEAFNNNGWFHTGDIGIIDSDGFLRITDRKKDIIVTAAGKNVAPQNIENLFKTDPMISQVMIHGDKRKFLSALITLNQDELVNYANSNKISFRNYSDLVRNEKIYRFIKDRIDLKNQQLAKYETVKKFAILDSDFSIETGELTPTMKVKRKFTSEKYKDILEQFYKE